MKRREFIIKAGQTVALAALAGGSELLTNGCQSGEFPKSKIAKPNFEIPANPQLPKIVLAKNTNHIAALQIALSAIGGVGRFIHKGERVLIKPNVAWDRVPEQAVNTNPILVGEMVRQCKIAGAADIIVTDYGTHNPTRTFLRSGIKKAVEENGGRIVYVADGDFVETDLKGIIISKWPVLKYTFEVDRLINMPIAKHHGLVAGTASMKNFFGMIGGDRSSLHRQLDQVIVDLASFFRPTLTIVDATRVLIRNGPAGGSLDDVVVFDSVICATDQVAADSRASEFLGITGIDVNHVVLASKQGLGKMDYREAGYKEFI